MSMVRSFSLYLGVFSLFPATLLFSLTTTMCYVAGASFLEECVFKGEHLPVLRLTINCWKLHSSEPCPVSNLKVLH